MEGQVKCTAFWDTVFQKTATVIQESRKIQSILYSTKIRRVCQRLKTLSPQYIKLFWNPFKVHFTKEQDTVFHYMTTIFTVSQFCTWEYFVFVVENKVCYECIWLSKFPYVCVYPVQLLSVTIIKVILQNNQEKTSQTRSCESSLWHGTKQHTDVGQMWKNM